MKISFQDGVSTLYNKCVSCGSTPSNKTPTAISQSIEDIYNTRYNEGYTEGKNDGYDQGYDEGIAAAQIEAIDVFANQGNFGSFNTYGLSRSIKFTTPETPAGKTLRDVFIRRVYVKNTNQRFGSGTFEVYNDNGTYYVISRDCVWPEGGTSASATVAFVYL